MIRGRRRGVIGGVAVVLVALLSVLTVRVVTRGPNPVLFSPVHGHAGVGQGGLRPGELVSEGDIPLCLDTAGAATIASVELVDPTGGLRVVAFGIRTVPAGTAPNGDAKGDLAALGLTPQQIRQRDVTNVCDAQSRQNVGLPGGPPAGTPDLRVELDITLSGTTLPATTDSLRLHYRTGGRDGVAVSDFGFALCQPLNDCQPP